MNYNGRGGLALNLHAKLVQGSMLVQQMFNCSELNCAVCILFGNIDQIKISKGSGHCWTECSVIFDV